MKKMTALRFPRYFLVGIASILVASILAVGLFFIAQSRFAPQVLAASLQQMTGTTCAQAPSQAHCDQQDPEVQGCTADATTIAQANIVENGVTIGSVERRYSGVCHTWWGRVINDRIGSHFNSNLYITIGGTTISGAPTFSGSQETILYSPMVFDAPLPVVPAITGTIESDGIAPPFSATIPAIDLTHLPN